ncbi:rev protein [Simian immunodeficiency virus]|uniref:Protein Rev n=1 Tax=Simian immunodeficiency virus TaxID=11723 RepID=I6LDH0_SIV|nr:rev protein [Simian immunodeficiency virus]
MSLTGGSGRGEDPLLAAIRRIRILYQSSKDPYPEQQGSRSARRRRYRRWKARQLQVEQIASRILEHYLGRSDRSDQIHLPDLSQLSLADLGPCESCESQEPTGSASHIRLPTTPPDSSSSDSPVWVQ